jgi:rhodanese-related sulfurtransferase
VKRNEPVANSNDGFKVNNAVQGFWGAADLNQQKKGISMQTHNQIHDPARAKAYFEEKLAFTTGPVELDRWIKTGENNLVVVDVREAEDFEKGHVPGAINLPKEQWGNPEGLGRDKTNVVYCYNQQCHLAANACVRFAAQGIPVMEMEGGFAAWKERELDVEEESTNRLKGSGQKMAGRH